MTSIPSATRSELPCCGPKQHDVPPITKSGGTYTGCTTIAIRSIAVGAGVSFTRKYNSFALILFLSAPADQKTNQCRQPIRYFNNSFNCFSIAASIVANSSPCHRCDRLWLQSLHAGRTLSAVFVPPASLFSRTTGVRVRFAPLRRSVVPISLAPFPSRLHARLLLGRDCTTRGAPSFGAPLVLKLVSAVWTTHAYHSSRRATRQRTRPSASCAYCSMSDAIPARP